MTPFPAGVVDGFLAQRRHAPRVEGEHSWEGTSLRCTRNSITVVDGQIDLHTHRAYARDAAGVVHRVRDALSIRHLTSGGPVVLLVAPGVDGNAPDVDRFTPGAELPTGWERRRTDAERAAGSDHLDVPRTPSEVDDRQRRLRRLVNTFPELAGVTTSRRERFLERYVPRLAALC